MSIGDSLPFDLVICMSIVGMQPHIVPELNPLLIRFVFRVNNIQEDGIAPSVLIRQMPRAREDSEGMDYLRSRVFSIVFELRRAFLICKVWQYPRHFYHQFQVLNYCQHAQRKCLEWPFRIINFMSSNISGSAVS
jgi:hypothetical protein